MQKKQLYLIDGYALIYRAYFALMKNPLTNAAGQPTGAIYGFAGYLLRLLETYDCPYVAVVMDAPKPTFRHLMYDKYKANREEMPEELHSQIPIIRRFIDSCNIPTIIQQGLEADDLIASTTLQAVDNGFEVFLVTRDKDLMQLIGPRVTMLMPEGGGTLSPFGAEQVKDKMGVGPEKIIDYLALVGDSSDNIPGVPGVGPKTASKILSQVAGVDELLADTTVIRNPKLRMKIDDNREQLILSKQLVTLKTDTPPAFTLDELARQPIDTDACSSLLREMECRSLLRSPLLSRVEAATAISPTADTVIGSVEELSTLLEKIVTQKSFTLLSFSSGVAPIHTPPVGFSIAVNESEGYYLPLHHPDEAVNLPVDAIGDFFLAVADYPDVKIICHNCKQEFHHILQYGVVLKGAAFDPMIAAYLLDPGKRDYDCATLFDEWLMRTIYPVVSLLGSGRQKRLPAEVPVAEAAPLLCAHARSLIALEKKLRPMLFEKNVHRLFESIELPLIPVLTRLEQAGARIDEVYLHSLSNEYGKRLALIADELYELAGEEFNINSPKQIGEVLFDRLHLPAPKKTKTGAHATGVEILEKLATDYPIARKILDYRELQKLLSTYIDALPAQIAPASGRVHTTFNQTIAATGRLSSTDPNLQNIPIRSDDGRRIRNAFIPADGKVLISADYSQIELRILAHLSDDPLLKQAFKEDRDIHTQTASAIYGIFPEMVTPEMRRAAKTINFGLMYGMGPINLARQLGISFNEARSFIETYFMQFPTIKRYMETTIESARNHGYTETLLGRRRYLPDIATANRMVREAAERTAINTPVQGTAADIIKIAMINIDRSINERFPGAKMILQVHDELVFESPEENGTQLRDWVVATMSTAYELSVPLRVDAGIGKNWNEAH
ncbi:MAG: DNA polymerase I [Chitinispirillaceae bacterium]|nr:DNA polymerase I [Chitinispirillaceae bacterium]